MLTSWRFSPKDELFFLLVVLHSDGKTWYTLCILNHTMIFTAAVHRVHTPVETDCLEANLIHQETIQ